MSLRELNAARTRELILDAAITVFTEQGYDASTLEDVAERAGVSISTLYRYFPTKDLLVLEPIALRGQMAAELRIRPADEPMDVALGHAIQALFRTPRGNGQRLRSISALVATSAALRARLREEFVAERALLQEAIASRLNRSADDIYCAMTARITMGVFELAGVHARSTDQASFGAETFSAAATHVMNALHNEPPAIPSPTESQVPSDEA